VTFEFNSTQLNVSIANESSRNLVDCCTWYILGSWLLDYHFILGYWSCYKYEIIHLISLANLFSPLPPLNTRTSNEGETPNKRIKLLCSYFWTRLSDQDKSNMLSWFKQRLTNAAYVRFIKYTREHPTRKYSSFLMLFEQTSSIWFSSDKWQRK